VESLRGESSRSGKLEGRRLKKWKAWAEKAQEVESLDREGSRSGKLEGRRLVKRKA